MGVAALTLLCLSACTTVRPPERATDGSSMVRSDTVSNGPFFFHDAGYGSESVFGPASVFLNRGFDVFQFSGISRHLADFPFRRAVRDVTKSVARPHDQIEKVGLGRFMSTELLPLTFSSKDARWFPNYTLHLIGGGISYRALREWYASRGVRAPGAWSSLVVLSSGFMNEIAENRGKYGLVADHVADLYVFDIAGVLLFSMDGVARFFSHKLHAADWSPVPSITTAGNIQNAGQFTVFRPAIPGTDEVRLFVRLGLGGLIGVSVNTNSTDAISLGVGTATDEQVVLDSERGELGIRSRAAVGLFYDRRNSLLASLVISPSIKEPVVMNIYPGVLPLVGRHAGLWVVMSSNGRPTVGVSLKHTFGLGLGVGR